MSDTPDNPIIYIIEDSSAVCLSLHAMLEAADYDVQTICDANCFSRDILQSGLARKKDIILIDLEAHEASSYRLVNMLIETPNCPGFLLLSDDGGSFLPSDEFVQSRLEVLRMPISPQSLLAGVEAVL